MEETKPLSFGSYWSDREVRLYWKTWSSLTPQPTSGEAPSRGLQDCVGAPPPAAKQGWDFSSSLSCWSKGH